MSKCELQIVFDRTDRTYRPGDTVRGTVLVVTHEPVQCDALLLTTRWETHGAGNRDAGTEQKWTLFRGQWLPEQLYEYPFSFPAPPGPPTYHGHYLNVDHYVRVQADVPWSFDPKAAEEYVLLPGPSQYPGQPNPAAMQASAGGNSVVLAVVGIVMIVIGVFFLCPMGLLIPVGVGLIAWSLRRIVAEWRTGTVRATWGRLHVTPGETVPMRLEFTPGGNLHVSAIRATLRAREECVRGSGTDKKTSRHVLHESVTVLAEEGTLPRGQTASFQTDIAIPSTACYSFSASSNRLIWEVETVVAIPGWPDWAETRVLCVRPPGGEAAQPWEPGEQPLQAQVIPSSGTPVSEPPRGAPLPPLPVAPAEPESADAFELAEPAEPAASPPASAAPPEPSPLVAIFDALATTGRYSSQRDEIVEQSASQSFACDVAVERVERTYAFDVGEALKNGRTVVGTLAGTPHKLSVQTAAANNDVMDGLQPGQILRTEAVPVKWNMVHDRLEMREVVA